MSRDKRKRLVCEPGAHPTELTLHVQTCCLWEVTARKVGNVHRTADFTNTTLMDFLLTSAAISPVLADAAYRGFGQTVLLAVNRTQAVCRQNTTLGIVLALVPIILAESLHGSHYAVGRVVAELGLDETTLTYEAIRLANPGGLGGASEQDVREPPTIPLREAMKLAEDRDMIARQYANGFTEVFDFGVPALVEAFERFGTVEAAIVDSQLRWLAEYPDSLIARKNGAAVAQEVQRRAGEVLHLGGITSAEGRHTGAAFDHYLRSEGNKLNPGTTADLIAACLFVALRENKLTPSDPFPWKVEDWL